MLYTYNPETTTLVVSWISKLLGSRVSKIIENWDEVTLSYSEDRYEYGTATTGQVTRSKIINKLGTATIVAATGSDCNSVLGDLVNSKSKINLSFTEKAHIAAGPSLSDNAVMELNGASITDPGDLSRAKAAGQRSWVLTGEIKEMKENTYTD